MQFFSTQLILISELPLPLFRMESHRVQFADGEERTLAAFVVPFGVLRFVFRRSVTVITVHHFQTGFLLSTPVVRLRQPPVGVAHRFVVRRLRIRLPDEFRLGFRVCALTCRPEAFAATFLVAAFKHKAKSTICVSCKFLPLTYIPKKIKPKSTPIGKSLLTVYTG